MHKALTIAMVLVVGALPGCVQPTKQPRPDQVSEVPPDRLFDIGLQAAPTGSIAITRDVGLVGAGCYLGVYVDGKPAAHFKTGERAVITLSAGRHVITSRSVGGRGLCGANSEERQVARSHSAEIFVEAGQVRSYRIHTRLEGEATIEPVL
ncbi:MULTISPECIES: hypothetical protein [Xanthomonas]|uniref:hypothetical protein n=1 Tax=Xanthomonas TaxID=338 RepID=UPI00062D93CB|nr:MULTISPECIES: hypothetical protein [Xanthomonas]KLC64170.1 hypothetical protein GEV872_04280 [Xanthomonas perforans]KLC68914.1 hypothetical protein GEV893_10210 [Xanthomonas perforans]KLC72586.1 hypothetical protein GEV909_17885 [Xanthomonas perforans]KLC80266.1 hypothetical protein GEV915_11970 [Xanthomonas perforans]KLC80845.1 hypothetical protein GEV904_04965 [Xanthomonas perforans]